MDVNDNAKTSWIYVFITNLQSLRLSNAARQKTTVGEIVNLMSVDSEKLQRACTEIHDIWASPLTVVVGLAMLWQVMGLSTLAGIVVLIISVPINGGGLTKLYIKYQVNCCCCFFQIANC